MRSLAFRAEQVEVGNQIVRELRDLTAHMQCSSLLDLALYFKSNHVTDHRRFLELACQIADRYQLNTASARQARAELAALSNP